MLYSVWNTSRRSYDVYESNSLPMERIASNLSELSGLGNTLGFSPKDEIGVLPGDSRYLGSSEGAQGQIVFSKSNVTSFFIVLAASVLAKWIYDKIIKD